MSAMDLIMMNRQMTDNPLYVHNDNGDRIDLSDQPMFEQPNFIDSVGSDLLNRNNNTVFGRYMYNGVRVPRVTYVLSYCAGNREYLMEWAARLGDNYTVVRDRTLSAGTKAHEVIAEYLTSGTTYTMKNVPRTNRREVKKSVNNFMAWYNHVTLNLGWKVEIFLSEVPLICPWCGGTADAILIINGRKFLVDFKTSKKISPDYFIQVSAYKWILDNFYPQYGPIEGVGILRFDKSADTYEDIFLEMNVPQDAQFILHCQQVFGLALNMFYTMNVITAEANNIRNEKKSQSNIGAISEGIKQAPVVNKRAEANKEYKRKRG